MLQATANSVITHRLVIALIAVMVGGGHSPSQVAVAMAVAQRSTPIVSPEATDPANCTIAPRPAEDFRTLPEEHPQQLSTPVTSPPLPTNDYFARSATGPGADVSADVLASLFRPKPFPADQRVRLVAIADVQILPSGQVSAVVTTTQGMTGLLFTDATHQYRIDGSFAVPAAATPSP